MTLNEYATLIYWWYGDAEAKNGVLTKWGKVPLILDFLESQMPQRHLGVQFGAAGVALALEHGENPAMVQEWRRTHRELYRRIEDLITSSREVAEWADFYIGQWLISHDLKHIDAILDQAANGGDAGHYASRTLSTTEAKCKPFAAALRKAREARKAAMLVQ